MRGSRIEVVLGTAQFAPEHCQGPRPKLSDGRGVGALLNAADSVGVAALDTAPARGDAESAIGDARCATPVHTKIDPALNPPSSLECSLGRMGRARMDGLYVHYSNEVLLRSSVLDSAAALVGNVGRLETNAQQDRVVLELGRTLYG